MIEKIAMYLEYPFVRYALIVGVLISLCSSLLGVTLVLKRFSFIGDGLSHVAFFAMAVAAVLRFTNNLPVILLIIAIVLKIPALPTMFLAAGGEDERTPAVHTEMMEKALRSAGVPVEALYYRTEGHGFYVDANRREYYTRLLAFLGQHLGGRTVAATP